MSAIVSRRELLRLAASGAAAWPALAHPAAAAPHPALREIAAGRGLLYGSYLNLFDLDADPQAPLIAARECGVMVAAMDWSQLSPTPTVTDFKQPDIDYRWARDRDMKFRGHVLVWGEDVPKWFPGLPSRDAAVKAVEDHIALMCRHFAGRMQSWDVVNEAIKLESGRADGLRETAFLAQIGPEYLDISFHAARRSDPAARLVYNEFGIEYDMPEQSARRRVLLGLLDGFKKRGTPIDAVGIQSHLATEWSAQFNDRVFSDFLREISDRGLGIMLTELDVRDRGAPSDFAKRDAEVAAVYRRYLEVALDNRAVSTVITWGLFDRDSAMVEFKYPDSVRADGLPPRPLPFDSQDRPKPAYAALAEALQKAPKR
jgi:endo-1,4-beta-xylanase